MAARRRGVARAVGYTNAGTIEFLLDEDGAFYFLEMNTRLQVEHPVTEMVTGIDLVQWQIRIARGERLDIDPERALTPRGHAIECRIYAEDPDQGFMPSPGLVRGLRPAAGPGMRDDGGVSAGYTVPVFYDSMIAKLIAWAATRARGDRPDGRALREYQVLGIRTTIPFFLWLMHQPEYIAGRLRHDVSGSGARRTGARRRQARSRASTRSRRDEEEVVAIGAALDAYMPRECARRRASRRTAGAAWDARPRGREALRG